MKNARVIACLLFAIGANAVVIGLSGFTANALAKPKMPSLPRVSGTLATPKMPSYPRASETNVKPKMPSLPRVSENCVVMSTAAAIQTPVQLSAKQNE